MKRTINVLLVLLLFVTTTLGFLACKNDNYDDFNFDNVQNLIILIGDGMGLNHIDNTKTFFDLKTQSFENNYISSVNTNSLTSGPTDSAAAATALATGISVLNGQVGHNGVDYLKNIMEIASENNKLTGIITNDTLTGATPAAYSAHAISRNDIPNIISTQSTSPLDLMIGKYDEEYYNNESLFTSNGFVLCDNKEDLFSTTSTQKVIANLNNIYSIYNPNYSNQTNLVDLVNYAINYLDNENGFVLMIECAYIDKFSHSNDIISALAEVRTLFDIADSILGYIKNNPDTALVITSDHETGGLRKSSAKENINNALFSTVDHTDANVGLFARGIKVEKTKEVKNTEIFNMCYNVINKFSSN